VTAATFDRPLSFEANLGQAAPEVRYLARAGGYTLQLQPAAVIVGLQSPGPPARGASVRMRFLDGGSAPDMQGVEERPGRVNYLTGSDPRRWQTGVPLYAKVRSNEVYPGIDVLFYGRGRHVEFDLVVRPGGDPKRVRMAFEGAAVEGPDASGALTLRTGAGELELAAPIAYQLDGESRRPVRGAYRVDRRGTVRIELDRYDRARPLVVDPVLTASRFLGGGTQDPNPPFDEEGANGIALDSAGNVYVAGWTSVDNFPTFPTGHSCGLPGSTCAYQQHNRGRKDVFVTKFNAAGDLVYSTYVGGSADDLPHGLAVDAGGQAYITGETTSQDFPTTSAAYQRDAGLGALCVDCDPPAPLVLLPRNAFVTKLNAAGTALVYSSYLGGSRDDVARAIAVDDAGRAHVTGETRSDDFPATFGAARVALTPCAGDTPCADAFVAALDPAGSALAYSTYLGGAGNDQGRGIAVDADGNAYVTGKTASADFPTRGGCNPILGGPLQQCFDPLQDRLKGASDVFVSKVRLSGALAWSTYLGGGVEVSAYDGEAGNAIAVRTLTRRDGSTDTEAYVGGETTAADFPVANAFQNVHAGGANDAFVARLNSTGSALIYSTFLGGADHRYLHPDEAVTGIALGADGSAYVVGWTTSVDGCSPLTAAFPVVRPAAAGGCPSSDNREDAFVAKLAPAGGLQFSTLLGGAYADRAHAVALDSAGAVYVAGETQSTTGNPPYAFPTVPQASSGLGRSDAFVSRLVDGTPGSALLSIVQHAAPDPSPEGADFTYGVVVKNESGAEEASNVAVVHTLSSEVELRSLATTAGECTVTAAKKVICNFGALLPLSQADVSIVVRPNKKAQ